MTPSSQAWMSAPVAAAVITGLVAIIALVVNQYQVRRDGRRKDFAEALAAVERYAELPYRVLRRQESTPEVRGRIAEFIHDVQQDLLFHQSWMRIQAPRVADAYDSLLRITREEAGAAMTEAWSESPIASDEAIGIPPLSRTVRLQATAPPLSLTSSYFEGLEFPRAECLLPVLWKPSMYSKIAVLATCRLGHE